MMVHINRGDGKHEWLTKEQLKEKYPEAYAALNKPAPYAEYGRKMMNLRKAADLSIRELAKKLGWSAALVCDIEQGRVEPTMEQVEQYQRAVSEEGRKEP